MSWLFSGEKNLEKKILEEIDTNELFKHVEYLSTLDRISGGSGEDRAIEYIKKTLEKYGVPVELHKFASLLSYPKAAELELLTPEKKHIECITHAFSASGEASGELVFVNSGQKEDYEAIDVKGRIVLCKGLTAGLERMAEDHGARAAIHIRRKYIHEDIVTVIWGTPTPRWIHLLPSIPIISINKEDGAHLQELTRTQHVRVRVKAITETAWKKIKVTVASIPGTIDSKRYLLIGGHIDSWYKGVTDNATGNATCLELAKIFMKYQQQLKRGVKITWWPGHSTGRYSGSAWYADTFWLDLHENCIAYMNIDSPGIKGGTVRQPSSTPEALQFVEEVLEEIGESRGQNRWGECKMGDQSFLNLGIPSISFYTSISKQHDVYGSGGAWWWHTKHDTLDKADKAVLTLDTKVYAVLASRLCTYPILPFDYTCVADTYVEALTTLQSKGGSLFDLTPALKLAENLREQATKLNTVVETLISKLKEPEVFEVVISCLIQLSRVVNPILHMESGKYDQDPAILYQPLPILQQVVELKTLDPKSSEFRFLKTQLIRQRNKVAHALYEASTIIRNTLSKIEQCKKGI
ncbi:MAG: M28 family peptidase [Candidatus Heimdallarchaeota archaeon]